MECHPFECRSAGGSLGSGCTVRGGCNRWGRRARQCQVLRALCCGSLSTKILPVPNSVPHPKDCGFSQKLSLYLVTYLNILPGIFLVFFLCVFGAPWAFTGAPKALACFVDIYFSAATTCVLQEATVFWGEVLCSGHLCHTGTCLTWFLAQVDRHCLEWTVKSNKSLLNECTAFSIHFLIFIMHKICADTS